MFYFDFHRDRDANRFERSSASECRRYQWQRSSILRRRLVQTCRRSNIRNPTGSRQWRIHNSPWGISTTINDYIHAAKPSSTSSFSWTRCIFFFHVFNITFLLTQCLIFVTTQFPDPSISECPPSFLGYRDGILVRSASPLCHHTQDRLYPQSPCCLPVSDVNWFRPWVIERSHLPVTVHQPLGHPPGWTRSVFNRVFMLL